MTGGCRRGHRRHILALRRVASLSLLSSRLSINVIAAAGRRRCFFPKTMAKLLTSPRGGEVVERHRQSAEEARRFFSNVIARQP